VKLIDTNPAANWGYAQSLGRAFAGAIIFGLPLLMTMEMWWFGFYLERERLLQFIIVNFLVLTVMARMSGFEPTVSWADDVLDAFAAYGIAVFASALALWLFAIIGPGMTASEIVGKIAIQSVPASFGAMIAGKQLGDSDQQLTEDEQRARSTYLGQLFLMFAGALFLGFNVAPTEEMAVISFMMTPWHSIALVLASIILLHALVYAFGFRGEEEPSGPTGFLSSFVRFSIAGYGVAIAASLYVLWTFGRTDGLNLAQIASMVVVLGFPASVGAAIARLVV
jgi:putative integral membrane protein (TIGR02587 family)